MKTITQNIILFICGLSLSLSFYGLQAAWFEPTDNPPLANTGGTLYADSSNQQKLGKLTLNASSTALVISPGKLGIGTLIPEGKVGLGNSTSYLDNSAAGDLILHDSASGTTTLYDLLYPNNDFNNNGDAASAARTLGNNNSYDLGIITNNVERIRMKNNGYVGVGTTTPNVKLEVGGGMKLGSYSTCDSTTAGTLIYSGVWIQVCNGSSWVDVKKVL